MWSHSEALGALGGNTEIWSGEQNSDPNRCWGGMGGDKQKSVTHIKQFSLGKCKLLPLLLLNSALASMLLKPSPLHIPNPEKREYPALSLKGLVQSHKLHTIFLSSQIPGCLMGRILLGPSSLSITLMPPWSKQDFNSTMEAVPSYFFLVSGLRDKPLS